MAIPTPTPTADFDPGNPQGRPLKRCVAATAWDPLHPIDRGTLPEPPEEWKYNVDTRVAYYQGQGMRAERRGDTAAAVSAYETAARFALVKPERFAWQNQDALLRLGRSLYGLGFHATARHLWSTYLARSQAPDYRPMARALRLHQFKRFFALAMEDSESYTQRNPIDLESGGLQWIYAGAEEGARGDFARAQRHFREAMNCGLWDPAYAVFAWGAAAYALGNRAEARDAWVAATGEGDSSPGDMPFNNNANAASVTMLLDLYD